MAAPVHTEQRFTIRANYIVSTPIYTGGKGIRSKAQRAIECNLKDNTTEGQLSSKAAKRMRNSVNWLIHAAKFKRVYCKAESKHFWFKVNFITLTVPYSKDQQINGEQISKCLHTWLVYARKYFYLRNYVWKVERGTKGKLHIHLTTDTFIHYRKLRDSWNRILTKEGLNDDYFNRYGHYDPNSTDVHAVRKVNNLAGYIAKYMTKETDLGKEFKNRIWGCSQLLSEKNKCRYVADKSELTEVAECLFTSTIRWKRILSKEDSMGRVKSIGEIFFINQTDWCKVIHGKLRDCYAQHIKQIRDNTPLLPLSYLIINEPHKEKEPGQVQKTGNVSEKIFNLVTQKVVVSQLGINFN